MPDILTPPLDYSKTLNEKLGSLKVQGNYRYFLEVSKSAQSQPVFYRDLASPVINWTSNDYLGMSADPEVIQTFIETAQKEGVGSGGTRNISGTTTRHVALEQTLAALHKKPAALIFSSAYVANSAAISTLARAFPDTLIFSDAENHASMIEGIQLSRCEKLIFRHNDLEHLETLLKQVPLDRPKLIAFESVYSMSGTVGPIEAICHLAKKYNALTYLDEVHAVGLYGKQGEGVAGTLGCADQIDIINGTLGKSFGCMGGYVAGSATLIDYIRSFGPGFIFTTSLPPAVCAAATHSICKVMQTSDLRVRFRHNVNQLRQALQAAGIAYEGSATHITRVILGDARRSKAICDQLLNAYSIYLQPINYPTVPRGKEGLRIVATARHTEEQIQHFVSALSRVLKQDAIAI